MATNKKGLKYRLIVFRNKYFDYKIVRDYYTCEDGIHWIHKYHRIWFPRFLKKKGRR